MLPPMKVEKVFQKKASGHQGTIVTCDAPRISKCEKRKRATYEDLHDKDKVRNSVMEQAMEIQANLDPNFPSFIKLMLRSHVTGGFWLGLAKRVCNEHLPKQDTWIVLEDESGKEYITKYLAEKMGLSARWRGFSIDHKLVEGDVLVFHLLKTTKFKVYIARSKGSDEVDGALGLLKLETCNRHPNSEKHITKSDEEDDKYWEPLAKENPLQNIQKDNQMISSSSQELVSEQSEDESKDLGSEVLNGIKFCESKVDFKEVKSFKDFSIVVNDLIIDSALSKHLRTKYYELCRCQNSFLHNSLVDGLNCRLISGMISETINIADAIRASNLATLQDNFDIWGTTLKAFKMMGMNVRFLLTRLDQLMNLTSGTKRIHEARLKKESAEEEKRTLELKLSEVKGRIDKLESEIEASGKDADRLNVMFQVMAKAPW